MRNLLVDTDILIDFLRGKTAAKEFLMSALPDGVIYCSTITVAEIYAGMKDPEREKTSRLIDSLNVVDVTREIATALSPQRLLRCGLCLPPEMENITRCRTSKRKSLF